MDKVSVVIRNKNQSEALEFLLKNLTGRYSDDIDEIIVIDNCSTDTSKEVISKYGAKLVTIEHFSYGGSANLAAQSATNPIVVIFSAHAFPVSDDFFKQISTRFQNNSNLAGLRCLHNASDYRNYINSIAAAKDPNVSGLIFCGSAFHKRAWQLHPFKDDITTMEDKEWSVRVLKSGFDIEFSPSVFCYEIKRSPKQLFFRFKNEVIGGYQLWHVDHTLMKSMKSLIGTILNLFKNFVVEFYFAFKRFSSC